MLKRPAKSMRAWLLVEKLIEVPRSAPACRSIHSQSIHLLSIGSLTRTLGYQVRNVVLPSCKHTPACLCHCAGWVWSTIACAEFVPEPCRRPAQAKCCICDASFSIMPANNVQDLR